MRRSRFVQYYSKIHLKNKLRLKNVSETESNVMSHHMSLIVKLLDENTQPQTFESFEGKTKEELLILGLSVYEIQKYFVYQNCRDNNYQYRWYLKQNLQIHGYKIRSIKDLKKALELFEDRKAG